MQDSSQCNLEEQRCVPLPHRRVREKRYTHPALGVVVSGNFDYRAQNGAATAVPGTVILGNRAEYFRCHPRDCAGNRRQVVTFGQTFLDEVAESCGLTAARFQIAAIPPGRFSGAICGSMSRLALRREDREEAAYDLARAALRVSRGEPAFMPVSLRSKCRVLSVVRHLEDSYHQAWSLASLASMARLSPCYFLRVFRCVTGQSPTQYLMNARLRAVARDLLNSRAPVQEIALKAGFNDISHFNASFRLVFGRSPTRWRQ
jgi:AraC family transcriptional regulator